MAEWTERWQSQSTGLYNFVGHNTDDSFFVIHQRTEPDAGILKGNLTTRYDSVASWMTQAFLYCLTKDVPVPFRTGSRWRREFYGMDDVDDQSWENIIPLRSFRHRVDIGDPLKFPVFDSGEPTYEDMNSSGLVLGQVFDNSNNIAFSCLNDRGFLISRAYETSSKKHLKTIALGVDDMEPLLRAFTHYSLGMGMSNQKWVPAAVYQHFPFPAYEQAGD